MAELESLEILDSDKAAFTAGASVGFVVGFLARTNQYRNRRQQKQEFEEKMGDIDIHQGYEVEGGMPEVYASSAVLGYGISHFIDRDDVFSSERASMAVGSAGGSYLGVRAADQLYR